MLSFTRRQFFYSLKRVSTSAPTPLDFPQLSAKSPLASFQAFPVCDFTTSNIKMASAAEKQVKDRMDAEKQVKRNPHPDFKKVEASRPQWDSNAEWNIKQTLKPDWKFGDGANDGGASLKIPHVDFGPYDEGRPAVSNYKLLISGIIPRPIGFISTISKDGSSTNLAPFSYFSMINHDPPLFTVGYAGGFDNAKDSLRNLSETGECCINIISEHFIEAANSTSVNAPYGESEWSLSGLTPAPCKTVKASRVKEAIFAIEAKLDFTKEYESKATPGKKTGVLAVLEGTHFWVREDAINEDRNIIDPLVLKPISRLGGITYGRTTEGVEIPRPDYAETVEKNEEAKKLVKPKVDGQ